jgi:hypothetical protein
MGCMVEQQSPPLLGLGGTQCSFSANVSVISCCLRENVGLLPLLIPVFDAPHVLQTKPAHYRAAAATAANAITAAATQGKQVAP